MSLTRRALMKLLAAGFPALRALRALGSQESAPKIHAGPFKATRESLRAYKIPDWFRDAKFGIWAHWGPQSAAEYGDWYARDMYLQGNWQYEHHVKTYGHPSKFGFKDIIPTWKAASFDADYSSGSTRRRARKYFVSLGVHHDNFDLWDSKYQRWNSVTHGAAQGHRRRVPTRRAQTRPALRRQRTPLDELQVVLGQPRQRQGRPARRSPLRRRRPPLRRPLPRHQRRST